MTSLSTVRISPCLFVIIVGLAWYPLRILFIPWKASATSLTVILIYLVEFFIDCSSFLASCYSIYLSVQIIQILLTFFIPRCLEGPSFSSLPLLYSICSHSLSYQELLLFLREYPNSSIADAFTVPDISFHFSLIKFLPFSAASSSSSWSSSNRLKIWNLFWQVWLVIFFHFFLSTTSRPHTSRSSLLAMICWWRV